MCSLHSHPVGDMHVISSKLAFVVISVARLCLLSPTNESHMSLVICFH